MARKSEVGGLRSEAGSPKFQIPSTKSEIRNSKQLGGSAPLREKLSEVRGRKIRNPQSAIRNSSPRRVRRVAARETLRRNSKSQAPNPKSAIRHPKFFSPPSQLRPRRSSVSCRMRLSFLESTRRLGADMWSMNSTPLRWSTSCCTTRAMKSRRATVWWAPSKSW